MGRDLYTCTVCTARVCALDACTSIERFVGGCACICVHDNTCKIHPTYFHLNCMHAVTATFEFAEHGSAHLPHSLTCSPSFCCASNEAHFEKLAQRGLQPGNTRDSFPNYCSGPLPNSETPC